MAAAAVAAHATVLGGGLVWLDDAHLGAKLALRPPAEWTELFRQPFAGTGYYRPLTALSLSLDALAGSPAVYHATNLGLHAASAALLLFAAEALGASRRAATLGALLFAVHPIGSLVAGAIAFRSEALVACGLFGLVVAHRNGRPGWAALALLGAGLSKETGLALAPLFVVALELGRRQKRQLGLLGAEALALGLALGLRLAFAPAWGARFPELSAGQAVGTRLGAFAKSAGAVLLPLEQSVCDAFPILGPTAPLALAGGLFVAGLLVLGWRGRTLGLLCVLSALPSLQVVPTLRWWSPHYLYVPVGLFLVLSTERLEKRGPRAYAVAACLVALLAALSWRDGRRYRSDETLWRPEVLLEPACREGHFYLAEAARTRGELGSATLHYEAALRSRAGMLAFVDLDATLTNYGLVLFAQGRYAEARGAFEAALEQTRDELGRRKLRHDLAAVSLASGDAPRALRELEAEVRRPDALRESLLLHDKARRALEAHQPR